jgi:UDP-GlcNAc:undecaprenyl-phosphate/decaprenyl-phosphate GlcNAc-1-phosphate transferase
MIDLAVACLVAAALGFAGAEAMARGRFLVDKPNERSSHKVPTPRGGGVGLVAGALLGAAWIASPAPELLGLAAGALIAGLAGLLDDRKAQEPLVKFGAQFLAAFVAMAAGLTFERVALPGFGTVELGWAGSLITLLWFVGLTNAYNFMDGLDALAGATGAVAAIFLGFALLLIGQAPVAMLAFVLAAACLGFLAVNRPPARVFMGDVGSQFLGFAFAGIGVLAAKAEPSGLAFWLVPLALMHFLFDTVFTAARRALAGENVLAAHRTHLYQRLNQAGFSHGRVASFLAAMAAIQGNALLWLFEAPWPAMLFPFALQLLYARWVLSRSAV